MEIVQLILLGCTVGFLSSFFGIGGGSITVPVLYSLYPQMTSDTVVPASLGCVFVVCLFNTYKFYKLKLLPSRPVLINLIIFCSLGGLLGAQALVYIDTETAKKIMAVIMLLMVAKLYLTRNHQEATEAYHPNKLIFALTGLVGAFVSSITGLGGGIVFTPVFINILKVPVKLVSPLSNIAMLVATLIGTIPHLFFSDSNIEFHISVIEEGFIGNVNLILISVISVGALIASPLGVKYNSSIGIRSKKIMLGLLLLVFSIKLLS